MISNINEIIVQNVLYFNIGLLVCIALLTFVFYALIRRRIKYFLETIRQALLTCKENAASNNCYSIPPREFEGITDVFSQFFQAVDTRLKNERKGLAVLEQFVESPDESTKSAALKILSQI